MDDVSKATAMRRDIGTEKRERERERTMNSFSAASSSRLPKGYFPAQLMLVSLFPNYFFRLLLLSALCSKKNGRGLKMMRSSHRFNLNSLAPDKDNGTGRASSLVSPLEPSVHPFIHPLMLIPGHSS